MNLLMRISDKCYDADLVREALPLDADVPGAVHC